MNILFIIRMPMMVAMSRRPPKSPSLHGGITQNSEDELHGPRSSKRTMRKVPVIESRNRKHPNAIQSNRGNQSDRAPAHPKHEQAAKMKQYIGDETTPIKLLLCFRYPVRVIIRIPPLTEEIANSQAK